MLLGWLIAASRAWPPSPVSAAVPVPARVHVVSPVAAGADAAANEATTRTTASQPAPRWSLFRARVPTPGRYLSGGKMATVDGSGSSGALRPVPEAQPRG